jgi:hypothetical protein
MREQRIQETTPLEKSKLMAAGNATKVAVAHLLHAKLPSRPGRSKTYRQLFLLVVPSLSRIPHSKPPIPQTNLTPHLLTPLLHHSLSDTRRRTFPSPNLHDLLEAAAIQAKQP